MNKFKLSTGDIKYMCFFHQVNTTLISLQFTEDYKEFINAKSKDVWKGINLKFVLSLQLFIRWFQHPIASQDMHGLLGQGFLWRPNVIEEHTQQVLLHILQNLILP